MREGPHEHSFEKQYTMTFRPTQFGEIHVDAVSVMRKFVQTNRIVYGYTARLAVVGTELVFREYGGMILCEASSAQPRAAAPACSLYQVSYRIFVEKLDPHTSPGVTSYLQDFIMNTQTNQMRAHRLEVQNALLHEIRSDGVVRSGMTGAKLLIDCPVR